MKILLTTNKLQQFAGAEMVTLEIAEYYAAMGHDCTIAAWFLGPPMRSLAQRQGITLTDRPELLNAFDYDLVWAHHHIAPVLQYQDGPAACAKTFFAWRHLSVVGRFEMPGLVLEDLIADRVYAVSEEARALLDELGIRKHLIGIFPNPAPAAFHLPAQNYPAGTPRSVLAVSNHAPPEVLEALAILRAQGVSVRHVGKNGEGQQRVTPALIRESDVVLTIGKTVQYALCCRRPVYVYDHFGGPGYLDADNFAASAWHNFSGRCERRMLTAAEIAQDIVSGHEAARRLADSLPTSVLDTYRLEPYLERLLDAVGLARPNTEHRAMLARHQPMLRRERAFCAGAGAAFRGAQSFRKRLEAVKVA